MRLLLISIIIFIPLKIVIALENKIITKIENEIITSIDIENEKNYLKALNPNIRNIDEDKLNLISKNSLIREKICLLYTSPSPRDLSTSRMPSSA